MLVLTLTKIHLTWYTNGWVGNIAIQIVGRYDARLSYIYIYIYKVTSLDGLYVASREMSLLLTIVFTNERCYSPDEFVSVKKL